MVKGLLRIMLRRAPEERPRDPQQLLAAIEICLRSVKVPRTLVARIKELINRGGEKISPREIDEVLLTHPSIAEAVCFGVPHGTWGEEVEAAVVLREGESVSDADLIAFCKERMADFKRPKQIHITQAIPRTATGKIQRGVVAKAYSKAS